MLGCFARLPPVPSTFSLLLCRTTSPCHLADKALRPVSAKSIVVSAISLRSPKKEVVGWTQTDSAARSLSAQVGLLLVGSSSRFGRHHCRGRRPVASRRQASVGVKGACDMDTSSPALLDGFAELQLLAAIEDRYDGVIIQAELLPEDVAAFKTRLQLSISYWKVHGKKGVWLKLPLSKVDFLPEAIKAGFDYHHADPGYCMLTLWLPATVSTLPANASHQLGVGAFLLNEAGEVLAVQEKNGPLRGTGVWKLPTGVANLGEDIAAAAVREVKEETGIDAEFEEILCLRQAHGIAHGKSDLFLVCALRPLSFEITPQESEIADAKWMSLQSFRAQPFFADRSLFRTMMDVCAAYAQGQYKGLRLVSSEGTFPYQMYVGDLHSADKSLSPLLTKP